MIATVRISKRRKYTNQKRIFYSFIIKFENRIQKFKQIVIYASTKYKTCSYSTTTLRQSLHFKIDPQQAPNPDFAKLSAIDRFPTPLQRDQSRQSCRRRADPGTTRMVEVPAVKGGM